MDLHLRAKMATEPASWRGELRSRKRRYGKGRRIRKWPGACYDPGHFRVAEYEVMEVPLRCRTLLSKRNGAVPRPRISTTSVLNEEILGAPQNPQRAAIRSKCLLVTDKYEYRVGQPRPNSRALGLVAHC